MRFGFRSVTLWCGEENIHRVQDLYVTSGRIVLLCRKVGINKNTVLNIITNNKIIKYK